MHPCFPMLPPFLSTPAHHYMLGLNVLAHIALVGTCNRVMQDHSSALLGLVLELDVYLQARVCMHAQNHRCLCTNSPAARLQLLQQRSIANLHMHANSNNCVEVQILAQMDSWAHLYAALPCLVLSPDCLTLSSLCADMQKSCPYTIPKFACP